MSSTSVRPTVDTSLMHDDVAGAATEDPTDRERAFHHQHGPDVVDREDFDDAVHAEDRRRFGPRSHLVHVLS